MSFKSDRPTTANFTQTDRFLDKLSREVERFLQQEKSVLLVNLDGNQLRDLAQIIVEFAEDTHFEIGFWEALERHNEQVFGNPLPFSKPEDEEHSNFPFDEYRLHHLLWNALTILQEGRIFSPQHIALQILAEKLSYFLEEKMERIPKINSLKKFLSTPSKNSYDIKEKLMWIGRSSYLFRHLFNQYIVEQGVADLDYLKQVDHIDDFVYRETTLWSGLGALDICKETIALSASQKEELGTWYEPHRSFYEIKEINSQTVVLNNRLNDRLYELPKKINFALFPNYRVGDTVLGALVPFNGKWFWAGQQSLIGYLSPAKMQIWISQNPKSLYINNKQKLARALKDLAVHEEVFLEYFGNDLVVFDTGKDLAEASFKKMIFHQQKIKSKLEGEMTEEQLLEIEEILKKRKINPETLHSSIVYEHQNGVALFFNKILGEGTVIYFYSIKEALEKEGKLYTEEGIDAIHALFYSKGVSGAFIKRLLKDYSEKSIVSAFSLKESPDYWLDYFLRRYKGKEYRNQYPNLIIIDNPELLSKKDA